MTQVSEAAPLPRPIGLLVSQATASRYASRIEAIAAAAGASVRLIVAPADAAEAHAIDAAFFSRELYEGSSVRRPGEASRAFFAVVDAAPRLQWLHVCSSGLDLPQYEPSLARGVRVTGASGSTAIPIAQSLLAAVLAQSRGFTHWLAAQRERTWKPLGGAQRPRDIEGQRAVVVGAGPIALEIGRLLGAVGFRTTAVRRTPVETPHFHATVVASGLDAMLPGCDWLVLACPLTDATRGLLDARRLALLPSTARLANVARGELVDEAALIESLRAGRLAGAYLDVFASEPLAPASPLWTLPEVWITPHNCAASQGHDSRVAETFLAELEPWLRRHAASAASTGHRADSSGGRRG